MALNLSYSGCCVESLSSPCNRNGCYCDQNCHNVNDCCGDIADIGCHPSTSSSPIVSPTPTHTLGKKNCWIVCHLSIIYFFYFYNLILC